MSNSQEKWQLVPSESGPRHSCSLCKKTFEHEATAKRHYYYCRSKTTDAKASRKRSCVACVRAKARCMWPTYIGVGACIRCTKRNVACEYNAACIRYGELDQAGEESISTSSGVQGGQQQDVNDDAQAVTAGTALVSTRNNTDHHRHETTTTTTTSTTTTTFLDGFDPIYIDIGAAVAEWEFGDNMNMPFSAFEPDIEHVQSSRGGGGTMVSLACDKIANLASTRRGPPGPWTYRPSNTPLFACRAFTKPDHVALVSLALRVLRSYPSMMLIKGTVPPFVHPSMCPWTAFGEGDGDPRKSLVNCSNLVQSFQSRDTTNKNSWVWGQIWHEQERILAEYSSYDRWELLNALQTLLIFCLLRLRDTPVGHTVFDVSLLTTVNLVSEALGSSVGARFDCVLPEDPALAWKDWIFLESRRRTVLLFQILGLLVDISTAVSYFSLGGLVLVPLPSSTALWNPQDLEGWKPEYKNWREQHTIYALSEIGTLIKLQGGDSEIKSNLTEWEPWTAQVGELATLVMIIGELLKG